jgi:hypothetical protein
MYGDPNLKQPPEGEMSVSTPQIWTIMPYFSNDLVDAVHKPQGLLLL